MDDQNQLLITSDTTGTSWSSSLWNIATRTCVHSYKGGGTIAPNTLNFINNDYLIGAERFKPLLHLWPVNSQEIKKNIRLVCPGKVQSLAISPDGAFCAAGIEEKLYMWQIANGRLLKVANKHFQHITSVEFTSDGSFLVTVGNDALLLIWRVDSLVSQNGGFNTQIGQTEPLYSISDHSMAITGLFVGKSGSNARIATVSSDRTMKLYQLISGKLLLSVVFDKSLTAVTMNLAESKVYIGAVNGTIFEFSLLNPPRNREFHANEILPSFDGHKKTVTTLSVSTDGQYLASGSSDEQVIIWHIQTKQKIWNIPHKGAITTSYFITAPKNLYLHDFKPATVVTSFQRSTEEDFDGTVEIIQAKDCTLPFSQGSAPKSPVDDYKVVMEKDPRLISEINQLKSVNAKLYKFALEKIVCPGVILADSDEKKRKLIS